ncbi:MAG: 1-deoxy-D-xylulose-5-phosphate reductoisomerase [bacterium]
MKRIVILGSTGSIGVNALRVIKHLGPDYSILGLSARSNSIELLRQAMLFRPKWVSVLEPSAAAKIRGKLPKGTILLSSSVESLMEMASHPDCDLVLNSMVGSVGFAPLVAAIKAGKSIALANKEPMVMAGEALMREARRWNASIIPVDSEPSAIFQCMQAAPDRSGKLPLCSGGIPSTSGESGESHVSRIFLTASGGAFYRKKGSLDKVTPEQALAHPNWKMGPKITVDCATLMNKGLEAIEIMNLFSLPLSKIKILLHPQSIIHSAVEFPDGSVMAQMSLPDMKLPIQYALTYPERKKGTVKPMDFFSISRLDFIRPDTRRFPCLGLALEAARRGGTCPAVLNAANEVGVDAFLKGKIPFTGIARVVEKMLRLQNSSSPSPSLAEVVETDQWARGKAAEAVERMRRFGPGRRTLKPKAG